jgi:hypothetical protein
MEAIKLKNMVMGYIYSICGVAPFNVGNSTDKQLLKYSCTAKPLAVVLLIQYTAKETPELLANVFH